MSERTEEERARDEADPIAYRWTGAGAVPQFYAWAGQRDLRASDVASFTPRQRKWLDAATFYEPVGGKPAKRAVSKAIAAHDAPAATE